MNFLEIAKIELEDIFDSVKNIDFKEIPKFITENKNVIEVIFVDDNFIDFYTKHTLASIYKFNEKTKLLYKFHMENQENLFLYQ